MSQTFLHWTWQSSTIIENPGDQNENFLNFDSLVKHLKESVITELGILDDDDFRHQIVKNFLLKGLLDEFLPNYDEAHG